MRVELERLVECALSGDRDCCQTLFHLLDNCLDLEEDSADRWKGQLVERPWPDDMVQFIAPVLAYFLPTPAELQETKRRLRMRLWREGHLDPNVLGVLGQHADRSVFYPLVDVLEAYDGDPSRYDEIAAALRAITSATYDAPEADVPRAKRALKHVREIGAGVIQNGHSLGFWADNALGAFGEVDEDLMGPFNPLAIVPDAVRAALKADDEAKTADVLLLVDNLDEECASHLKAWVPGGPGRYRGGPLAAVGGSDCFRDEERNLYGWLRSAVFVSRVVPSMLPRLMADVTDARWQKPELVQLLVKDDAPHFVVYHLSDGQLHPLASQITAVNPPRHVDPQGQQ